jgi:hypothetical protein
MTVAGGAEVTFATGAILTEQNGGYALLLMMLSRSDLDLLAALAVQRMGRDPA